MKLPRTSFFSAALLALSLLLPPTTSFAAGSPPYRVTGLSATLSAPDTITLRWDPSPTTWITAYRIYYGLLSGTYDGTDAGEGTSPLTVPASVVTATLSGLPTTALPVPVAPVLQGIDPLAGALMVGFSTVPGATGYRLYYSPYDFADDNRPPTFVDTLATPFVIASSGILSEATGLTPGVRYTVAVSAMAQRTYYIVVTAVVDPNIASSPGSLNESDYSEEVHQGVGPLQLSALSNRQTGTPVAPQPYVSLKGGGCFIATAAYGTPFAPQVGLLREFRDRYLLTNAAGRSFVSWYYRESPKAAALIEKHTWLKTPVRLLLSPLVLCAWLALRVPGTAIIAAMLLPFAPVLARRRGGKTRSQERAAS
ncbi:CFI-box-CTERM domain-containing protein [Geomonas azotofigens]|uniref:CFI-box-CTERM domain-containing protein n=1 Tax=Geomonas azotofigens TaxID=2843196 RepID=UPI001C0FFD72|nr:CFI-box-CTERM domain-containing protein [Geomonas azotofigens]MBU5614281.1 fibronectin type III domain-containing protein [Geomonas azotofigens]